MTDEPTHQADTSYLATLVGEGQKYSSPEELAKAYVHASQFIETLKQENQVKDQKMEEATNLIELLSKANDEPTKAPTNAPETPAEGNPQAHEPAAKDVDVESVVEKFLAKKDSERKQQEVADKIQKHFNSDPTKIAEFLNTKARELGMSVNDFDSMAARSPAAVLTLLGISGMQTPAGQAPVTPDKNTAALSNQPDKDVRNFQYYNNLRRENPNKYFSPAMQRQKEQDLKALGVDKFFEGV